MVATVLYFWDVWNLSDTDGKEVQSMIRVALCDDEQTEVVKTHKMLIGYGKSHRDTDFDIGIFESAEQLLTKVREGYAPDIILMDIYMGTGQTGIDAARELRTMGIRSRIIFLTSSEQHALEAFRVEAAQYLVKPVADAELFSLLDKQLDILDDEKQKYIALEADNKTFRVMVQNIVYCEAQGKRQYLYMADGTQICVRMTMAVLEELFMAYEEIIRIGKWYIINMDHVESLNSQAVQMSNGQILYLSRGAYQSLRKRYITYYMRGLS